MGRLSVDAMGAALRKFGCVVEVVPGAATRGSDAFNPGGVVGHHTAGSPYGDRPTLALCVEGRSDLDGPLCNVFQARSGAAVIVAAGRANHAGSGGFRGLVGNSSVLGIEAESKGTEPNAWTPAQMHSYPRIVAGLLWLIDRDESWYCRHATWTPRKIDTVTLTDAWMRDRVGALLRPAPMTVLEGEMFRLLRTVDTNRLYVASGSKVVHLSSMTELDGFVKTGLLENPPAGGVTGDECVQLEVDRVVGAIKRSVV